MKILHVLHHSTPYLDGYCIRSKQIVDFERAIGLDVRVITSPQHEIEVERPRSRFVPEETIDGVVHHRTPVPNGAMASAGLGLPMARRALFMRALEQAIRRLTAEQEFDLIHAHSPVLCGLPALRAASGRALPLVYEVRGFWEDGFLDEWRGGERSLRYKLSRHLETRVFRGAAAVVGISQHILDDIAGRGIPPQKLFRVPNGVDARLFGPADRDAALVAKHGLHGAAVVGFIGSFYEFEGLESLIRAMVEVRSRLPHARLVLVGGGEQQEILPRLVAGLGLQECVILTGRVPHRDVPRYYSLMDLVVYPRTRSRTTDLTTPLKPLEAMAMGKPVLGSDVGGVMEILDGGRAGRLFEAGNPVDLANQIVALLEDPAQRAALAEAGRAFALRERSWDALVARYRTIYEGVVASAARSAT